MNIPNLVRAQEVLRDVVAQERDFDLTTWAAHPRGHSPEEDNLCGYTACAVGYCMVDPVLQSRGLGYHVTVSYGVTHPRFPSHDMMEPKFEDLVGFDAVNAFFDIGGEASSALFTSEHYDGPATAQDVVDRIQFLLENGEDRLVEEFPEIEDLYEDRGE